MATSRLADYLALLTIRQAVGRRDATILGGVFAIFFIATITLGMLDQISGRSLVLVTGLVVIFGIGYLASWVKFQIINSSIEFINYL